MRMLGATSMRAMQVRQPSARRYAQRALVLAGLGFVALAPTLASINDVAAQSREVYLGSGTTQGSRTSPYAQPNGPPAGYTPPAQRPYGWQRQSSETDGLLEDALDDLQRGRVLEARRLLEMVVEQFGNTASADEARRLLAPIYARMHGQPRPPAASAQPSASSQPATTQPVTGGPPPAGWAERTPAAPAPIDPRTNEAQRQAATDAGGIGLEMAAERKWKLDANRVRVLTEEFRDNVGDRIFFSEASAELGARSRVILAAQADWLKRYPDVSIAIESHADDHGSQDFNRELARRRAAAVRERLIAEGVAASRIRVNPQGRDKPVATCTDAACTAQNRRAVTQLVVPDRTPASEPRAASDAASGPAEGIGE